MEALAGHQVSGCPCQSARERRHTRTHRRRGLLLWFASRHSFRSAPSARTSRRARAGRRAAGHRPRGVGRRCPRRRRRPGEGKQIAEDATSTPSAAICRRAAKTRAAPRPRPPAGRPSADGPKGRRTRAAGAGRRRRRERTRSDAPSPPGRVGQWRGHGSLLLVQLLLPPERLRRLGGPASRTAPTTDGSPAGRRRCSWRVPSCPRVWLGRSQ
mmetsp:Transcript_143484/g.458776  ORF Transcript_143484/g.458776 Transcript_143484/m.458776 type:complete len:213 (-) Transcript_143484:407-1045(-)